MGMIACDDCKEMISTSAKTCPKCGCKVRRTSMIVKIFLAILVIGFLASFLPSPAKAAAAFNEAFPGEIEYLRSPDDGLSFAEVKQKQARRAQFQSYLNGQAAYKKRMDLYACMDTDAGNQYDARQRIVASKNSIESAQRSLATSREVELESGVKNLTLDWQLGSAIVAAKREMANAFADYKRFGGKESSPAMVNGKADDPCKDFR